MDPIKNILGKVPKRGEKDWYITATCPDCEIKTEIRSGKPYMEVCPNCGWKTIH